MVDSTPTGVGPAVDDQVDAAAQIGQHMLRRRRRDMAGTVRGRRHHRLAELRQNGERDRVVGHPQRDGRRPAVASSATAQSGRLGTTRVSGPGQRACASRAASASKRPSPAAAAMSGTWQMSGLKRGPALGLIEARDRFAIAGIGAEPIDGLGREGDKAARGEAARRGRDRRLIGLEDAGHRFGGHGVFRVGAFAFLAVAGPSRLAAMRGRRYKTGLQSECSAVW